MGNSGKKLYTRLTSNIRQTLLLTLPLMLILLMGVQPAFPQVPFACTGEAFIVQDQNAQLTQIDQSVSPFTFVNIGGIAGLEYNATIPPGDTTADVDETTLPAGYVQTAGTDPTTETALADQNTDIGEDGYQPQGTVSGHLYIDTNGNGVQDAGEPDLANVDVIVTDSNGDTQTVTTDTDGNWTATVPPGTTSADVDETDPDYPAGYTQTEGDDPTTVTAVADADTSAGNDGYVPPAGTVSGHLYIDTNGNGVQDAGEPDLANVDVIVTDSNGDIQTVTTDADGNWTATVPPGTTSADVDETDPDYPAGSTQIEGDDPTTVTAVAGVDTTAGNDGYVPPAGTVSGHLYIDTNGNGTQDAGEPDLANVDVIVTDSNGDIQTVTTDATGDYSATVPAGDTTIDVDDTTLPAGSTQTEGTDPTTVTVPSGGTASDVDGYQPLGGTVTGHIYEDTNGNGVQDPGEPDLAGVAVVITDSAGNTQTVTTDATGNYSATVPAGDTTIDVDDTTLPAGSTQTEGTDPTTVAVPSGGSASDVDGYQPTGGTVTGHIYEDTNGNGTQDAGEPDLAGVAVVITDSAGNTQTVTTDATGDYSATVPAGDTTIDVDDTTLPAGSTQTEGTDPTTVIVPSGDTASDVDGYQPPDGTVSGTIFEDTNGDGVQDPGEPGLPGVNVSITDSNGDIQIVTTDLNGEYSATVPAGETMLDVDEATLPPGYVQTVGTDHTTVTVPAGGTATDLDGYQPQAEVSGHIFEDTNGNGVQDQGEPNLSGVDVFITDINGITQIVTTDANGDYTATVAPGDTTADVNEASLLPGSVQTAGSDPTTVIALAAETTYIGEDGYQPQGTVSGHIFEDTNGNGFQDPGEPDLAGVDVLITDSLGNTQVVTTDANGNYTATVPAGDTILDIDEATLPAGSEQTAGSDPTFVTVPAGGTATDLDGYQPQAIVFGHIFEDTDGHGVQDPGEPNLAGVDVVITDSQGGIQVVTTDANGNYVATVPAGVTTADVDETTLPPGVVQTAGADPTTVNVLAGSSTDMGDDGYQPQGTVFGHIFEDTNGNGVQDPGEPDLAGVAVVITDSQGGTQTVITNANGDYSAIVPAGETTADVDETTLPPGVDIQTAGTDPTTVNVPAGSNTDIGDDGYRPQDPVLTLVKSGMFNDEDGDTFADVGETITYTFDVTNDGNVTLTNVSVTDPMVAVDCGAFDGTLEPGETTQCSGTYIIMQPDIDAGQKDNTAIVASDQTAPVDSSTIVKLPKQVGLSLVKSGTFNDEDGDGFADVGETISYTFDVTNNGDVTLSNVSVDDPEVSVDCPPIPSLAVDATETCTGTYSITQADIDAAVKDNTATATAEDPDGNLVTDFGSHFEPLPQNPVLTLVKSGMFNDEGGDGFADIGETISYTFDVTNDGNVTLTNVSVTDPMVAVDCGAFDGILEPGETTQCSGIYIIMQPDIDAGQKDNAATVAGTDPGGNPVTDVDGHSEPLPQNPVLTLVKSSVFNDEDGDTFADVGETISYTFDVTNAGNVTLTNVSVTDPMVAVNCGAFDGILDPGEITQCSSIYIIMQPDIDAGQKDNTAIAASDQTAPVDSSTIVELPKHVGLSLVKLGTFNDEDGDGLADVGETISYTFDVINAGDVSLVNVEITDDSVDDPPGVICPTTTLTAAPDPGSSMTCTGTYTLTQSDIDAGEVSNAAIVTGQDANDPGITVTDSGNHFQPLPQNPVLSIVKSSTTAEVTAAGQVVSYSYLVSNDGNVTLNNVIVTDNNVDAPGVTCLETTLAVGGSMTCTAQHTVTQAELDAGGNLTNIATADSNETDPVIDQLDIPIVKPRVETTVFGRIFEDTNGNGVQDAGEPDLAGVNVVITDSEGNTQTVTTNANGDWTATVPPGNTTADVDENTLPKGMVQTAGTDPSTFNAPESINTNMGNDGYQRQADLAITKSDDVEDAVVTGDSITYTLTVKNEGPSDATGVVVTDTLPEGLTFISSADGCTAVDHEITCDIGELAAGATTTLTFVVSVDDTVADNTTLTNVATVSGNEADPDTDNNTDDETTLIFLPNGRSVQIEYVNCMISKDRTIVSGDYFVTDQSETEKRDDLAILITSIELTFEEKQGKDWIPVDPSSYSCTFSAWEDRDGDGIQDTDEVTDISDPANADIVFGREITILYGCTFIGDGWPRELRVTAHVWIFKRGDREFTFTQSYDFGGKPKAAAAKDLLPKVTKLSLNYPNPFNPDTWIPFELAEDARVRIQLYDVTGRLVRTLDLGYRPAGYYLDRSKAAYWDGRNEVGESVASGIYFYRLTAGDFSAIKRMVILR